MVGRGEAGLEVLIRLEELLSKRAYGLGNGHRPVILKRVAEGYGGIGASKPLHGDSFTGEGKGD